MHEDKIKHAAAEAGFDICGIAPAVELRDDKIRFKESLELNYHAEMSYLADNCDNFFDARIQFPWAKSVIACAVSYNYPESGKPTGREQYGKLSRYAAGADYHREVISRLASIENTIHELFPDAQTKAYSDTGHISEKAYSRTAGLGSIGRNTVLINKDFGSFIFLGVIITSVAFIFDRPNERDICGNCRICEKACPTGALTGGRLDAYKCISYQTNENRKAEYLPDFIVKANKEMLAGCDICQNVCPYNIKAPESKTDVFRGRQYFLLDEILSMTPEQFKEIFKGTPIERLKLKGLKRNAGALKLRETK